jgi:nitrogen fixation protein NifU and related proteins
MAYSDKVIDHYNHPRNVGSLPKDDPHVGTGLVGAPECGDVMKLQMKINPETRVIEEADIVCKLSLPPVKIHCSVLAEDAIKAAIGDWKKKHGVEAPSAAAETTAAQS